MKRILKPALTVFATLALSAVTAAAANAAPAQSQAPSGPHAAKAQVAAAATTKSFNQEVAAYVKTLEGIPYVYGGTSLRGFDCSGLTQYVYRHFDKNIQRTANDQFLEFRQETQAQAVPGDLVFFHETSNPRSLVYHVGVYEGGENMVNAPHTGAVVREESLAWGGDTVTFGTISH
jgi:peptidoglycan DL-endopeptidase CwlO